MSAPRTADVTLADKHERLRDVIAGYGSALVCFSGGVDSTLLLRVAHDVLGDRCVALTAVSITMAASERTAARELAAGIGVQLEVVESHELERPGFAQNPTDRCYHCKAELLEIARPRADALALGQRLKQQYGKDIDAAGFTLTPLRDVLVGRVQNALWALSRGAAFLLLIAGVNATNLFLALALSRRKESAVRTALGAPRLRLARQSVLESALLTAAALFLRGAGKAASVDTGLQTSTNYLLETDASLASYDQPRSRDLYRTLEERLAVLPGVESASISSTVPFGMIELSKAVRRGGTNPTTDSRPATPAATFNPVWPCTLSGCSA